MDLCIIEIGQKWTYTFEKELLCMLSMPAFLNEMCMLASEFSLQPFGTRTLIIPVPNSPEGLELLGILGLHLMEEEERGPQGGFNPHLPLPKKEPYPPGSAKLMVSFYSHSLEAEQLSSQDSKNHGARRVSKTSDWSRSSVPSKLCGVRGT